MQPSATGRDTSGMGALPELRRIARSFHALTKGWWSGPGAKQAWLLSLALGGSLCVMMAINVTANRWQGWFFDALEKRDSAALWHVVLLLPLVVLATAGIGVCIVLSRETLQIRWREWITRRLLERWIGSERFRRLKESGREPANPEYRIADDVRMTVEPLTDLVIGLVTAVLSALAFFGILWTVGGGFNFSMGGADYRIPAYFVLASLIYGAITSGLIALVGRSLIWKVAARNEAEAAFRSNLTLMRDRAAEISAARRAGEEHARAGTSYDLVVARWLNVVRTHGHITWITNSNSLMIATAPLLLASPKYLAGEMTLGEVVRVAAAFGQVQVAISWLVDNFRTVALWAASARRVVELAEALEHLDGHAAPEIEDLFAPAAASQPAPGE